jgi:PAS domain S-box-containing protein
LQPGAHALNFKAGLREAREELGRFLLGTHAPPTPRHRFAPTVRAKVAFSALAIGAATVLSMLLSRYLSGLFGAIFFPTIILCTLFGGWQSGVAAWTASLVVVYLNARGHFAGLASASAIIVFAISGALQTAIASFAHAMMFDRELLRLRLFKLVDASQGFPFVTDARGRPIEPHPRWTALTGMEWHEYRDQGWLNAVHPEDRAQFPLQGLPEDGQSFQVEVRVRHSASGDWRWHRLMTLPVFGHDGRIREWVGTLRDVHERKMQTQHREIVISELRHRLKNLMAIIEALAKYSAPRPGTDAGVDEFLKRFTGRLHALSSASDLLLAGQTGAIEANAVIRVTLAPFMSEPAQRFSIEGPELQLPEELGGGLALAIHELATNAIKYGALSVPGGHVALRWSAESVAEGQHVEFDWKEYGGPPPVPPSREGFGMRMIKAVTARENTGAVTVDFEPDGLHCRISFMRLIRKTPDA